MDFTRQPIIESVITPKEGFKLVVRSSKSAGQEEFFVDAVEVISFGNALFFRSIERPKAFLVPASDYEVLEVREARMVLKNVGVERAIKIGGGREAAKTKEAEMPLEAPPEAAETKEEGRPEKQREKRRHRRRRGRGGETSSEETTEAETAPAPTTEGAPIVEKEPRIPGTVIPPPTALISETLARYRDNALFKGAFFEPGEKKESEESTDASAYPEDLAEALNMQNVNLQPPEYGYFGPTEEETGLMYPSTFDLPEKEEKPTSDKE